MPGIINAILPVFIVVCAGYGAIRAGYLKPEVCDGLSSMAIRLAIPVLLFRAMYNLDFAKALQWPVLASFYLGAFASFLIASVIARKIFLRKPGESVAVGFGAMFSNTLLLGVPIAERAFGSEILPFVFGIIAFHSPVLYTIGIVFMEFARSDGRGVVQTAKIIVRSILANALMTGILTGIILNSLVIPLPEVLVVAIDMVAKAAIPIALIGIGGSLARYRIKSEISETMMVSIMSLVFHPALVFILSYYVLELQSQYVQTAVIIAAMPPGTNVHIFATMYNRGIALSASTIVIATSASIFTLSGWLWILSIL